MTTHLTEDELVLHYYGEMAGGEEVQAAAHLADCAQCHASFRRLQRVLAAVDERALAGQELPVNFERTVWARLEPSLSAERKGWLSWFEFTPARVAWVATVVVLVASAFIAGRLAPRSGDPAATTIDASQVRERILLIDLGDHLDRSQMVLVELAAADDQGSVDISDERTRAEQLVAANRLYRQTALSTGDTAVADLLDELERVLVDVAASPEYVSSDELNDVRRRIESRGLLFKVRVVSSDVRQRQRSIVQGTQGQRPSL
jgi:hypothetical protein